MLLGIIETGVGVGFVRVATSKRQRQSIIMAKQEKNRDERRLTKEEASALFLQYYDYVRAVAYRTAPTREVQDDIAHNVFIEFVENAHKWTITNGEVKPLLRTITKNISLQFWRDHNRRKPEHMQKLLESIWRDRPEVTLREEGDLQNRISILRVCMEKLSDKNKQIVELYYFLGLPYEELVKRTGKTLATLYSLLTQIRKLLHDCVVKTLKLEVGDD
ncbi:MAG: sigma-70 family RNA polymerase sigma factor [Planctomycetia bacterium]|nr:sigma-70 family RNA polymerase sigma factor [Planctomycetia bacterium]